MKDTVADAGVGLAALVVGGCAGTRGPTGAELNAPAVAAPRLEVTNDYEHFVVHEAGRPPERDRLLEESMVKHGFLPSSPVHVVQCLCGKLRVLRGRRRFETAKRLGLPVWYVVDRDVSVVDLEASSGQTWSLADFMGARSQVGSAVYEAVCDAQTKLDSRLPRVGRRRRGRR